MAGTGTWAFEARNRLHEAILVVGGYWRPLAAVARLLEELGELAEALDERIDGGSSEAVASELADLWVISTCIGNQYCVDLDSDDTDSFYAKDPLAALLPRAGTIARIVNYYDGPKVPRISEKRVSLGHALRGFHQTLAAVSTRCDVDLHQAVNQRIALISVRDANRFTKSFDPSVSDILVAFEAISRQTRCSFAPAAKLWGAMPWKDAESFEYNVDRVLPVLVSFAKCAENEGIDGLVVELGSDTSVKSFEELARIFNLLLRALCDKDPVKNSTFDREVDRAGWQFCFGGCRMFITVFSEHYDQHHPRHSPDGTFVMFQPETSFTDHGIGSMSPSSEKQKAKIRDAFRSTGYWYPSEIIDRRSEARIYILPRSEYDGPVYWWMSPRV
jgi:hypothetical protein